MFLGLNDESFDYSDDSLCRIEEAQKLLWNVAYNSSPQQINDSINNGFLDKILHRIRLVNMSIQLTNYCLF